MNPKQAKERRTLARVRFVQKQAGAYLAATLLASCPVFVAVLLWEGLTK